MACPKLFYVRNVNFGFVSAPDAQGSRSARETIFPSDACAIVKWALRSVGHIVRTLMLVVKTQYGNVIVLLLGCMAFEMGYIMP